MTQKNKIAMEEEFVFDDFGLEQELINTSAIVKEAINCYL